MGWWEDLWRPINFGKPDEEKRKEVMNRGYGFSNKDQFGDLGKRSQYTPPAAKPKAAVSNKPFRWPAGELSTSSYDESKRMRATPDDHYIAAKARMNPALNPPMESLDLGGPQGPQGPSLMEQILDRLDDPYGGFKGNVDTSALDAALRAQLGQIGQVRGRTNENFRTSDANILGMHEAARNEALTKGKASYQDIGNDQLAALRGTRTDAVGDLQRMKAEDNAKRMAMLKNLGIEAAAAEPTDTSALDSAIASITNRGAAEETNASEDVATNLAYNSQFADSLGQAGVQRRSELNQQLQSILGQLGQAEVEANQRYGLTKAEMIEQAKQQDYQNWQQNRQFDQSMYNNLFGQKMQLDEQQWRREQADLDRQWEMQKAGMQAPEVPGYGGLAEDLLNMGFPEEESTRAMQVLSQVLTSPYMEGIPEGYDKASVIARRLKENGIPEVIAAHVATNYSNLGNNNGFTPLPY